MLPESNRKPYDMYEVIRRIVDDGEYFDIKGQWAKTIITCFARFGGRPVGIVANQPKQLGGILDNDSADKAARFVNLCNAFAIPLVFLQDVPGFMVGTKVEAEGIIRHGAKMLYAVANATVPKITVITRKAYGAGYYVMNGRAYEPDLIVAWPSAEISVMGAEGVVEIAFRKQVDAAEDPGGEEGRADRGLPQDLRRLHRRRQRPDRRRDRPARDARDDLPRRWRCPQARKSSGRGSGREWCRYEPRSSRRHHLLDLGRDRQPRAVPGDPVHARRSTPPRRGGSSTRAACTSTSTRANPTARRAMRSRTSRRSPTRSAPRSATRRSSTSRPARSACRWPSGSNTCAPAARRWRR